MNENKPVAVTQTHFMGWSECYRIANGAVELVVVPGISRVMSFGAAGQSNLLWVNPLFVGQTFTDDDGQWHNFGGDKVWPTEQGLWPQYASRAWPPLFTFDSAASQVQQIPDGVRLTTGVDPHFGAACIREFTLDAQLPALRVRQYFRKSEGVPLPMSLWTVAQIRKPDYALLPLGTEVDGRRYHDMVAIQPGRLQLHQTALSLRNDEHKPQKAGVTALGQNGWTAAVFGRTLMVQSHALEKDAPYPDRGCQAEVYTATAEGKSYVELELLSPLRTLTAGQTLRDDAIWQVLPLSESQARDPQAAAEVAQAAHAQALKMLA